MREEDEDYDENKKLPTSYRYVGGKNVKGRSHSLPKKLKMSALTSIDYDRFSFGKLSDANETQVDALMYLMTNVSPNYRVRDLHCRTKGDFRDCMVDASVHMLLTDPKRVEDTLSLPTKDAAIDLALEHGFPEECL